MDPDADGAGTAESPQAMARTGGRRDGAPEPLSVPNALRSGVIGLAGVDKDLAEGSHAQVPLELPVSQVPVSTASRRKGTGAGITTSMSGREPP
ncbi:hypothetical protein GCM10009678_54190 [Actinomadura kijaniata]